MNVPIKIRNEENTFGSQVEMVRRPQNLRVDYLNVPDKRAKKRRTKNKKTYIFRNE